MKVTFLYKFFFFRYSTSKFSFFNFSLSQSHEYLSPWNLNSQANSKPYPAKFVTHAFQMTEELSEIANDHGNEEILCSKWPADILRNLKIREPQKQTGVDSYFLPARGHFENDNHLICIKYCMFFFSSVPLFRSTSSSICTLFKRQVVYYWPMVFNTHSV